MDTLSQIPALSRPGYVCVIFSQVIAVIFATAISGTAWWVMRQWNCENSAVDIYYSIFLKQGLCVESSISDTDYDNCLSWSADWDNIGYDGGIGDSTVDGYETANNCVVTAIVFLWIMLGLAVLNAIPIGNDWKVNEKLKVKTIFQVIISILGAISVLLFIIALSKGTSDLTDEDNWVEQLDGVYVCDNWYSVPYVGYAGAIIALLFSGLVSIMVVIPLSTCCKALDDTEMITPINQTGLNSSSNDVDYTQTYPSSGNSGDISNKS